MAQPPLQSEVVIKYPDSLPPPVRDGFNYGYGRPIVRLKMDDGGRRPVRTWAGQPREFSLNFTFSWKQLGIFEAWYIYETQRGSIDVLIPIKEGGFEKIQFLDDPKTSSKNGSGNWTVAIKCQRILEAPTIAPTPDSLPRWPDGLPEPEKDGYGYVTTASTHSEVTEGAQTSRLRFTRVRSDITLNLILTVDELAIFDNFVENTLISSLGWFLMPIAAGAGQKDIRISISDIQVSSQGAIYQVSASVDTFDIPELSKLQYEYPNGVTINETIRFAENYNTFFKGELQVIESIKLVESFARRLDFIESITLKETTMRSLARLVASEMVTLSELFSKSIRPGTIAESLVLAEDFQKQVRKILVESVRLSEQFDKTTSYNRATVESLRLVEDLIHQGFFSRELYDSLSFSENGIVNVQSYATDYFGEDYTGTKTIFANTWFTEMFGFNETFSFSGNYERDPIDTFGLSEAVLVLKQDYASDYFDSNYVGAIINL